MRILRSLIFSRKKQILSGANAGNPLSTWSHLATAFNSKPQLKRPSYTPQTETGLFGEVDLKSHNGFKVIQERAVVDCNVLIDECFNPDRSKKMVEIFDELSNNLCKVADLAEFIRIADPRRAYAEAAEDACVSISGMVETLNTHRELYLALKNVVSSSDKFPISAVDDHVARLFLFDFEQCGIHLEEEQRKKVVALNDLILHLGQRFMTGTNTPRSVPNQLVPAHLHNHFHKEKDKIIVSGLMGDTSNAQAREIAYKIYLSMDAQQDHLLSLLLSNRDELAKLCGFPTFSHRALKGSLAETPAMVAEFLDTLTVELKDRAEKDFDDMRKMKLQDSTLNTSLYPWDTLYFTQKAKRLCLHASSSEFSPYLSLGACMEGLNMLVNSLYGIDLKNEPVLPGEVWADDIYKLAVTHETEGLLGYIYCDFYDRPGKPNQDCHFTIRGGKELSDGSYQNPVVVLMLSLSKPQWSCPSLLTPSMVDNLFHEMGHALHSMLARTKYQHVTGTRCSTDFAEVPSVLMEYFAADPRVLGSFARHYQTGEKMPENMLLHLCTSKSLFAASEMQMQVFYSVLDQVYHGVHPLTGTTTEILGNLQNTYYGLPYVPGTAWQLRFSHLVGYGARYYSYLLSRTVASWIWQQYFENDPFSRTAGEKYRRECLAHGGGKPAWELVSEFLNKEVTPQNLVQSLINELDKKHLDITELITS